MKPKNPNPKIKANLPTKSEVLELIREKDKFKDYWDFYEAKALKRLKEEDNDHKEAEASG